MSGRPSLEVRRRIEAVLAKLREGPFLSGPKLRGERAVEALEHAGTPGAREMLLDLSRGAAEARLTLSARSALARLIHRPVESVRRGRSLPPGRQASGP